MSHPIDVGSVLGGRYKVTATVLTSHDQDLVLDGVDQVLNRPVSILVAGPDNADQVAQSAREVATGERPGQMQILDLGVSESTTYLITNHTSAADLLDLAVSSNPPYVEPFFTDTLGSEIFGQPRSEEPETYDGLYDDEEVDAGYINYAQHQPPAQQPTPIVPPARLPSVPPAPKATPPAPPAGRPGTPGHGPGPAAAAAAAAPAFPSTAPQEAAPAASQPRQDGPASSPAGSADPASATPAGKPKVSLWSDEDYHDDDSEQQPRQRAVPAGTGPHAHSHARTVFPASARNHDAASSEDDDEKDEEPRREPRSVRWLIGGLLAAMLVVGLVFAVSNLGSLFQGGPAPVAGGSSEPSVPNQPTTSPSGSATATTAAAAPVIEGVTRLGNFEFAMTFDRDLGRTFDGNRASYWSDMEFGSEDWGGFASEVPLVVKLKGPSKVSSVTLSQLGASGGSISIFTNDRPVLEGAKQVGSNSFTSPELTMPLAQPVTAQYVIVSIESLPKLAAPKTRFGYGLRLAEIKVQ